MRLKEVKISIHRKYTKNFNSYGYRIGIMLDVDKIDNARTCYYSGKAFLNDRIAEEDLIIKNLMDKKDAEKKSGYKELSSVPEAKDEGVVSHACEGCNKWITGVKDKDGKLFCKNCGKKVFPYATKVSLIAGGVAEKKLGYKELSSIPEKKVSESDLDVIHELLKKKRDVGGGGDVVMIPFDVKQIKRTSNRAVLVELFGTKGDLWIPKSCIEGGDAIDLFAKGEKTMLSVASWFLEKSGLM